MTSTAHTESVERRIAAQADRIFAVLADAARHREIDGSGTVREAQGRPEPLSEGSVFHTRMRIVLPYTMVNTVVEFEPDRRIAWQPRPAYPVVGRAIGGRIWRYQLEPVEGGTLVRETWDISREAVPALVRPLRGMVRQSMERTLERLDRLVTQS